jgi:hypothetical protein
VLVLRPVVVGPLHNDVMLSHARAELQALADGCELEDHGEVQGWPLSIWRLTEDDADAAVAAYAALLSTDVGETVTDVLNASGIDLDALLYDADGKDDITRADLTELAAAATMIAYDDCDADRMHMPNVPKMSRRRSDSGLDVVDILLTDDMDAEDLLNGERLVITSVKHTISDSSGGMRYALAKSLIEELTPSYLASQLRALNGRLRQEGLDGRLANRIFLFLRDFHKSEFVKLIAVGATSPQIEDDAKHHATLLPLQNDSRKIYRILLMPGIETIHEKCP